MLARIRSRVDQLASVQEMASRHALELSQLRSRLDHLADHDLLHLRRSVTDLRRTVSTSAQITSHALHRWEFFDEQDVNERMARRLVDRAHRTGRPVVAGPWTGEIGFELLYWIPFLRKLKARLRDVPLHVVSRGGVAGWYDGIADGYHDVFAMVDPEEFRTRTALETRKQRRVGPFDRRLLREASRVLTRGRPVIAHPSLMYRLLYPYWKDQLALRRVFEYVEPAMLAGVPMTPAPVDLPDHYIAARFYFSRSFPDTPANRALVEDVLHRIGQQAPVVLMSTPFAVDDHVDAVSGGPHVVSIAHVLTPENNLAIQTAVVAGASAFVGTYGGFSYLAPLCGVPSVAFYSESTFFPQHLEFARRTFARLDAAPFVVLHERERALIDALVSPAVAR